MTLENTIATSMKIYRLQQEVLEMEAASIRATKELAAMNEEVGSLRRETSYLKELLAEERKKVRFDVNADLRRLVEDQKVVIDGLEKDLKKAQYFGGAESASKVLSYDRERSLRKDYELALNRQRSAEAEATKQARRAEKAEDELRIQSSLAAKGAEQVVVQQNIMMAMERHCVDPSTIAEMWRQSFQNVSTEISKFSSEFVELDFGEQVPSRFYDFVQKVRTFDGSKGKAWEP